MFGSMLEEVHKVLDPGSFRLDLLPFLISDNSDPLIFLHMPVDILLCISIRLIQRMQSA